MTLANDIARCIGVGSEEDGEYRWREGCDDCLRRTSKGAEIQWYIDPPAIVAFECELRIAP